MQKLLIEKLKKELEQAELYPVERQAELGLSIMQERFEQVLPWAMEQSGFDFWIIAAREECEDPIMKTLFTWDMPQVRRINIIMFHRDRKSGKIRRMITGMGFPEDAREMAVFYEYVQRANETVWDAVGRIVKETAPERIAVNRSFLYGYCDGISSTMLEQLRETVGPDYAEKISDGEELTVRWLQRVTPLEKKTMAVLTHVTHEIIEGVFNPKFVIPGVTTTTDIEWEISRIIHELGCFEGGAHVDLQREGSDMSRIFCETVMPGDLLHGDLGICGVHVRLNTDMQGVAYIRKDGETAVPVEFRRLLEKGNRFQNIVCAEMQIGRTGNEIFASAIAKAKQEGLSPMLYTHPLGIFGHGAGPTIGLYSNQGFVPGVGERCVEDQTCYALELNVSDNVDIWNHQNVFMFMEEDIFYKDGNIEYLDGRQTELIMI